VKSLKIIIKNNILVLLGIAFIAGAAVISTADYFLWFDISAQEKMDGVLLWLTSLAIFWYAYEAYQLKISSFRQAETQEEIMLNDFLPILAPVENMGETILLNGNFKNLRIYNFGKGPAKYVKVFLGKVVICSSISVNKGEVEEIKINSDAEKQLRELILKTPEKLLIKIYYEDIYGRKFKSENIILDKVESSGKYVLRKGSWDFKRISTK
jgi:hypothetical protein